MARKLKTFVTSLGFFEEAIAAPSMKAALEAWGGGKNLFHKGFAKETDDPEIISAAMKHPGMVLKRPVGSKGPFKEHADLPSSLPVEGSVRSPQARTRKKQAKKRSNVTQDAKTAREAAQAYEREERRRRIMREKEKAAQEKIAKQRAARIAKAERAFEIAQTRHEKRLTHLEKQLAAINEKVEIEKAAWEAEKERLEDKIEKAKN
jgi:colicin import membrane protein